VNHDDSTGPAAGPAAGPNTGPGTTAGLAGTLSRRVAADQAGLRLDVFLTQQPEIGFRPLAKALVQAGRVAVEGRACKPGLVLSAGQLVAFDPKPPEMLRRETTAAPPQDPTVLFEDEWVLVIDKPAGLVCHPAQVSTRDTRPNVADWARIRVPGLPVLAGEDRPGIVHRLDKETSGVMVLAKTDEAFHFLKGEFRARRVEKEYRAISFGESRFDSDYIERHIGGHPKKGDRMTVVKEGGREASTYYEVVERFAGFTLFHCKPKTGRTHQIRVHMTSVGHGLVGDRFYRSRNHANSHLPEGAPDPARHCLHARRLAFRHPHSHETVAFEADLPPDMADLLAWLREHLSV
jgi:23S rRNA pseudouridine1911/1915/1917 synthase